MSEQETAEEKEAPPRGPGPLLQKARDARGLSREQIAERLHLELRVIVALEEDDFEALPEPPFVRGYLRAYANQVELSGDQLVAAFNACVGEQPAEGLRPVAKVRQASSGDRVVRLATWLIGLSLLLLVAIWWWDGHMRESLPPRAEVPPPSAQEEAAPPVEAAAPEAGEERGKQPSAPLPPQSPPPEESPAAEEAVEPPPTLPPAAAEAAGEGSPSSSPEEHPVAVAEPPPPSVEEDAPAPAVDASQAALRIRFAGDSWVSLKDATGKALLLRVARAGEEHQLQGVPPFKVVLGNAPVVELWYQGERLDLAPYTRGKVARFQFGEAPSP